MQILFAIAVLSCCALIWAAISITKHMQRTNGRLHAAKNSVSSEEGRHTVRLQQGPHPREDFATGLASRLSQEISSPAARKPPVSVTPALDQRKANGTNGTFRL